MGEGDAAELSTEALVKGFQDLSDYTVPREWKLPISAVESRTVIAAALDSGDLPPVARKVGAQLTEINRSVFLYGWARGHVTLSSNRTAVKMIEALVEGEENEPTGPRVWVCGTARSLVGKEKAR
jgi:hypothetical protein